MFKEKYTTIPYYMVLQKTFRMKNSTKEKKKTCIETCTNQITIICGTAGAGLMAYSSTTVYD